MHVPEVAIKCKLVKFEPLDIGEWWSRFLKAWIARNEGVDPCFDTLDEFNDVISASREVKDVLL